jgi:hypothetical protein
VSAGEGKTPGANLAGLNERNRIRALTTNVFALEVDAPRDAILVTPLPQATANWTGWVDGEKAPLLSVDGAFLGLRVPAGPHTLSIRYFSTKLVLGYRIAFATVLALAAAALARLAWARPLRLAPRAVLAAFLVAALVTTALPAYRRWERTFEASARTEATLNHDYPELLARQLERWRRSPRTAVAGSGVSGSVRESR